MNDLFNKIPFDNIHKSWVSSLIGALIILASLGSIFYLKYSWMDVSPGFIIGIGLLFKNDKKSGGSGSSGAAAMFLCAALLLSSCVTYQRCYDKYGEMSKDSVQVNMTLKLPVATKVPADSLKFSLLPTDLQRLAPGDTVYVKDTASNIQLKYWKDRYNNLVHARADYKSRIIHDTVTKTVQAPCPPVAMFQRPASKAKAEKVKKPGRVALLWDQFKTLSAWLLIALLIIAIIYIKIRKK